MSKRSLRTLVPAILVIALVGCDVLLPNRPAFPETRYYATGELRFGTLDYSIIFCRDGRADLTLSDYGVYGTYRIRGRNVTVTTPDGVRRYVLSADGTIMSPRTEGKPLVRNSGYEGPGTKCSDQVQR
jgi:hypothetical protein